MNKTQKQLFKLIGNLLSFKTREKYGLKYQNIAILGLVCILPIFHRYNSLVVSVSELIIVIPLVSFIVTFMFFKYYKKNFGFIWSLFHNLTIGLLVLFALITINSAYQSDHIKFKSYKIENVKLADNHQKGSMRALQPIIAIEINSIIKHIKIHPQYTKVSLHSDSIKLGIIKGNLGYSEIKSFEFIKK
ncbi:hypothetical protein [Marinifilum sp. D714]|uniref:hypothetical protein n=1 Tax=Marinifilum sp. D714 TaxID=2937523 RepID=UPI0027C0634A|nr:hypothetical protein [Marinifilum sp. D714]MDQ2177853.1 hypothetical protein [Marinifilum sp. D714]